MIALSTYASVVILRTNLLCVWFKILNLHQNKRLARFYVAEFQVRLPFQNVHSRFVLMRLDSELLLPGSIKLIAVPSIGHMQLSNCNPFVRTSATVHYKF